MIDIFTKTAKDKLINQDYIITNFERITDENLTILLKERNFIILADGCSQSKDSDVGARILCKIAQKHLEQNKDINYFALRNSIIKEAKETVKLLGLNFDALFATLIILYFDINELIEKVKIKILVYGDGIIGWKYKDQTEEVRVFFNIHNAPFYLMYNDSDELIKKYKDQFGEEQGIEIWKDGVFSIESKKVTDAVEYEVDFNQIESLFISSDGLESFEDNGTIVDTKIIVEEVFSLKTFLGKFLHRRMGKIIKNIPIHSDDISIGMLINK